ncbi:MAG TPA: hypothetical protein VGS19_12675 [Streptosporangiaceae bacterium]|nr:hypothetical protein [Streptosporangiaceae bacterium]
MYATGPPGTGPGWAADSQPLRVQAAGRCMFAGSSPAALDPMLRVYLSDLTRPYGIALHDDLLRHGDGHSYGDMADVLLPPMLADAGPVDLVVLAFAVHDVVPGRSTASHLSYLCPGGPMAFAVCDQGAAAPFTGLRLIRDYAQTGACQRALLVAAEQSAVPYDGHALAEVPARNAAVAVVCGPAGPAALGYLGQYADVTPTQAGDLLAGELDRLAAGRGGVTLVAGNGIARQTEGPRDPRRRAWVVLPRDLDVDHVLTAPVGQPCTGVWWELAGGIDSWAEAGRRILLTDYDPFLRYLCVCVVDIEASQAGAAPATTRAAQPAR